MKKTVLSVLTCLLTCAILVACGPSQAELDAEATAAAATSTTQTAAVPTSTLTPASTPTPAPILTPVIPASTESFEDLAHIFDYNQELALDIAPDPDGVRVYDISYASLVSGRVTAYLVVPPGEGPFAGLVFMHGGPANRAQFLSEAVQLAKMGAVSILIDAPPSRPEPWRREPDISDPTDYRAMQIETIIDLRRAVDLLVSRPDVDADRIGFIGHSYGAILGGVLAGVEHRIKAYVLMTAYPRFADAFPPQYRTREYMQIMDPIDPIHYIGHAAPSALFFQYGFYDESIPPELALECIDEASEPKLIMWYHAGHMLNTDASYDRAEWLTTQLGLDLAPLEGMGVEE